MPKPTSTRPAKPPSNPSPPPPPFTTPPTSLLPFLSTLPHTHIYITHIDTHPSAFKRRIFRVPILTHLFLTLLLLWRLWAAIPTYTALALATLGYPSAATIDVHGAAWPALAYVTLRRTGMFLVDWVLVRYIAAWVWDFVGRAPESAVGWRWKVGYADEEVVVRVSRGWDVGLGEGWWEGEGEGEVFQDRIMPAVERNLVRAKTGYMMMDKNWDLDFAAMVRAHGLVRAGEVGMAEFRKMVLVYSEVHGWLVWPVWKLDEGCQDEGRRRKIIVFKDKLTAMGKESLFFRWVELIQFETSQPGGFNSARQADALKKAKQLFESQGVDFERFWTEVGGVQGLPGMETVT